MARVVSVLSRSWREEERRVLVSEKEMGGSWTEDMKKEEGEEKRKLS